MFKKRKTSDLKEVLFDPNSSASEKEKIIIALLNTNHEKDPEVIPLLKEFLMHNEVRPIHPIVNYKGEFVSSVKTLIVNKLANIADIDNGDNIKDLLFSALTKYFSYKDLRLAIIDGLNNEKLNAKNQAIKLLFSHAWKAQIPFSLMNSITTEYLSYLSENEQSNHLYYLLLTPESASSDFPDYFNKKAYEGLVKLKSDQNEILLMLAQTMADKISKPGPNYYQNDYLKCFHEIFEILKENQEKLLEIEDRINLTLYLQIILKSVSQSEAAKFLVEYDENKISNDRFIYFWKQQIISRLKLRKNTLSLLIAIDNEEAQHELFVANCTDKYNLDNLKEFYNELNSTQKFANLANLNEILQKLEIILEIIEWSFIELLDDPENKTENRTKFEVIKAILTRFETLTKVIPSNDSSSKLIELLRFTTEEAINQYMFRVSILQKIFKSEEFLLKLQQREIKYLKMEKDAHHQLMMKFNNLKIISDKQKKRFLQVLPNINPYLVVDFVSKINDVVTRIMNRGNYYVIFRPSLKMYNPKLDTQAKETSYDLDDLEGYVKKFYINFQALIDQNEPSILAFRRIDAFNDLINDFLSYNGLIEFEIEYFQVANV